MKTKKRLVKKKIKGIKIQAKPLTESQIQEFVAFFNKNKSFPGSKIPCTVTGKLTTCVGPWMHKKIKEFGSAESLLRNYKCRGVLKSERQIIKPVSAKRTRKIKTLSQEPKNWDIPRIESFAPARPLTENDLIQTTKTQCLRPDIFLTNGRHCEGCEFYNACSNRLKCLPKWNTTDNKKIKK
jgi:hypothetical protein